MREINPTIPKDFADAIMRCLNKDPQDRFSTTMELRCALESVTFFSTRGETPSSPRSGVQDTRLRVIAGVAFLIGLIAGLLFR